MKLPLPMTDAVRCVLPALPNAAESPVRRQMSGRNSARCQTALLLKRSKCKISTANTTCIGISHLIMLCSQSSRSTQTCSADVLKKSLNVLQCLREVADFTGHTELQPSLQRQILCRRLMECWGLNLQLACGMARGISTLLAWDQPPGSPPLPCSSTGGESSAFYQREKVLFQR